MEDRSKEKWAGSGSAPSGDQSGGLVDRVRERASTQLNSQKNRATDEIGSAVRAVRQSTRQLRDQRHETVAQYIESAADQLDRFANRLKDKNVNEIFDDAQRLARQQPALFIGGAFALGLLGSRFLKSSSPERQVSRMDGGDYYRHTEFAEPAYRGESTVGTTGTAQGFGDSDISGRAGGTGTSSPIKGTSRDLPGTESY
jgi:hypothetical protein